VAGAPDRRVAQRLRGGAGEDQSERIWRSWTRRRGLDAGTRRIDQEEGRPTAGSPRADQHGSGHVGAGTTGLAPSRTQPSPSRRARTDAASGRWRRLGEGHGEERLARPEGRQPAVALGRRAVLGDGRGGDEAGPQRHGRHGPTLLLEQ